MRLHTCPFQQGPFQSRSSGKPQSGMVHIAPTLSGTAHMLWCATLKNYILLWADCKKLYQFWTKHLFAALELNNEAIGSLVIHNNTVLSPCQAAHSALNPVNTARKKYSPLGWKRRQRSPFWTGEEQHWGALQLEPDGFLIRACLCMCACMWTWAVKVVYNLVQYGKQIYKRCQQLDLILLKNGKSCVLVVRDKMRENTVLDSYP